MRRDSMLWCLALAWVFLVAVHDARADDEEVTARVVVDVAGTGSVDGILSHLQTAFGERFEARVVGVADAIDQGFGPWGVTTPAALETCPAEPISDAEIASAMDGIETAMMMLEYADADAGIDPLEGRLCAASGPLDPGILARIPFLRGVILYYAEDLLGARAAFRRAVELQPEMEWDANFPPIPSRSSWTPPWMPSARSGWSWPCPPATGRPDCWSTEPRWTGPPPSWSWWEPATSCRRAPPTGRWPRSCSTPGRLSGSSS